MAKAIWGGNLNISDKSTLKENVVLGNDVYISDNVVIGEKKLDELEVKKTTHIGNRVKIGANTVIMAGVSIGDDSVIAAGSIIKPL